MKSFVFDATGCVVVGVYEGRKLSVSAQEVDEASGGRIAEILRSADLEGKLGTLAGTNGDKFYLRETECLASCGTAPCMQINEDHHENLTKTKVDAILEKLA